MNKTFVVLTLLALLGCQEKKKSVKPFSIPVTRGLFNSQEHLGKKIFLFFGFTQCPHVCPTTLNNLNRMNKLLEKGKDRPEVLFVSVDPRDTMDVLQKRIEDLPSNFYAGTDSQDKLSQLMKRFEAHYRITVGKDPSEIFVDHSSMIYLLNSKGDWVASLNYDASPNELLEAFKSAERMSPMSAPHRQVRTIPTLAENKDCDLARTPCELAGYKVTIGPYPVTSQKEFKVRVEGKGKHGIPVEVDFEGVENNMGYIRPKLINLAPETFEGTFRIPVCEVQVMKWRASLQIMTDSGPQNLIFHFKTESI